MVDAVEIAKEKERRTKDVEDQRGIKNRFYGRFDLSD